MTETLAIGCNRIIRYRRGQERLVWWHICNLYACGQLQFYDVMYFQHVLAYRAKSSI